MNNKEINEFLARKLETAIEESGLKVSTILQKTGMKYTTLYGKRTGKVALTMEEAFVLCKVLNKPFSYFFPTEPPAKENQ